MLDYWNDGIMASGGMRRSFNNKIRFDMEIDNVNTLRNLLLNQNSHIPSFHHSMCEAKTSGLKIHFYFYHLWNCRNVLLFPNLQGQIEGGLPPFNQKKNGVTFLISADFLTVLINIFHGFLVDLHNDVTPPYACLLGG